jgi:hypothetical protein
MFWPVFAENPNVVEAPERHKPVKPLQKVMLQGVAAREIKSFPGAERVKKP